MLSLKQLNYYSDSLEAPYEQFVENRATRLLISLRGGKLRKDTISDSKMEANILDNFGDEEKNIVMDYSMTLLKGNMENISNFKGSILIKQKMINGYDAEYHKRIAFSLACLVLFFIGAPLGSIIRKGGFGLPMIMAIVIFVIYFFISVLGKNMAESNTISPFLGGWLATIILLPFGILLMIRATRDKGIFNIDAFLQPITSFFNKIIKFKKSH
jgi:lipopolysaccharide export system permease protein